VLAAMALAGLAIVWFNVAAFTLIQRATPAALLGRVEAALGMALTIPQAISIGVGAALIAAVDYRILLLVMAVVFLLCAAQLAGTGRAGSRGAETAALSDEDSVSDDDSVSDRDSVLAAGGNDPAAVPSPASAASDSAAPTA
jgi:MFS family permease